MNVRTFPPRNDRGFSLPELIIVVGIIMLMAAVAVPNIARYIRNYQIRAAAEAVAGEIQSARAKAITKNVNFGVVFLTTNNQTYRYVIEDDMTAGRTGQRNTITALLAANDPAQVGPARLLPNGILFWDGVTPLTPPVPGACPGFAGPTANDTGFRFNRLGGWCDPAGAIPGTCPDLGTGQTFVRSTAASGSTLCLVQPLTGLSRTVTIAPGGRVLAQK